MAHAYRRNCAINRENFRRDREYFFHFDPVIWLVRYLSIVICKDRYWHQSLLASLATGKDNNQDYNRDLRLDNFKQHLCNLIAESRLGRSIDRLAAAQSQYIDLVQTLLDLEIRQSEIARL